MVKHFFLFVCVMNFHLCLAMEDDWDIVPTQITQRGIKRLEEDDIVIVEDQDDMGLTQFFEDNEIKHSVVEAAALLSIVQERESEAIKSVDEDESSDNEIPFDSHKKKPKRKKNKKKKRVVASVHDEQTLGWKQDLHELWDTGALVLGMVAAGCSKAQDAVTQTILNAEFVQTALDGISRGGGA